MNYCNCKKYNPKKWSETKFRIVKVDKDGICLDCGHFALISQYKHNYSETKRVGNLKHSEETIKSILKMLKSGKKGVEISKELKISEGLISRVKNGKTRKGIII